MTDDIKLLPCPFCGGCDLELQQMEADNGETNYVVCNNCLANGGYYPGDKNTSPHEAAGFWNIRPPLDAAAPELLAALETIQFWLAQGNFSALPIGAIRDMQQAKNQAVAAIAKTKGETE